MEEPILTWFIGNDSVLEAQDIRDALTNKIISGAVVQATVYDEDDVALPTVVWPVTLVEVSNLLGTYRHVLPYTVPVTDEQSMYAIVTLSSSKGNARWKVQIRGLDRS